MTDQPSCGNCHYFFGLEVGVCRRRSPIAGEGIRRDEWQSIFPPMTAAGWCGEHLAKMEVKIPDDVTGEGRPVEEK